MKDFNKVCEELIANGCEKIENLEIKDVEFKTHDSYTQFTLLLNVAIKKSIIKDENYDGECYLIDECSKVIYTSNHAILSAMRRTINCNEFINWYDTIEDKDFANLALANELKNIHNHIDIIQQDVKFSEDGLAHHINPFNDHEYVFDHPTVINYIVNIY